jgi:hypothetical protein
MHADAPAKRICGWVGCRVILSRYNPGKWCGVHVRHAPLPSYFGLLTRRTAEELTGEHPTPELVLTSAPLFRCEGRCAQVWPIRFQLVLWGRFRFCPECAPAEAVPTPEAGLPAGGRSLVHASVAAGPDELSTEAESHGATKAKPGAHHRPGSGRH